MIPREETWDGLTPPYATIVADPPWQYDEGWPETRWSGESVGERKPLPYSAMDVLSISSLTVSEIADQAAHLYLWTTNRYLEDAMDVAFSWGFPRVSQILTWCKRPIGVGPGGAFSNTTEFVLFCRRGGLAHKERINSTWFEWSRRGHSVKPPEFLDIVERVSPGPYVELFARQPRLGWDHWGYGYEGVA